MEELQIIIEGLEKGIRNNVFSKMEIYSIQKCVQVVAEKVKSLEPKEDSKQSEE